jgi:hypothetical protein
MLLLMLAAGSSPTFAMLANPVEQGAFKSDVVSQSLRFQPFVFQDFFPLRQKFLIKTGLFHKLPGRRGLLSRMSHEAVQNESDAARAVNACNFS